MSEFKRIQKECLTRTLEIMAKKRITDPFETFAKNLDALRIEQELTFRALGDLAGLDKGTINNILNQEKKPSGAVIDKLAKALNVEVYKLFMPHADIQPDHKDLIEAYEESDSEGKRSIMRNALMERRHSG